MVATEKDLSDYTPPRWLSQVINLSDVRAVARKVPGPSELLYRPRDETPTLESERRGGSSR